MNDNRIKALQEVIESLEHEHRSIELKLVDAKRELIEARKVKDVARSGEYCVFWDSVSEQGLPLRAMIRPYHHAQRHTPTGETRYYAADMFASAEEIGHGWKHCVKLDDTCNSAIRSAALFVGSVLVLQSGRW